ncbi:ATP-binding protein [Flavilitoribacter nigricans]|uniref:Oxygen sensor histidine kinase NreB n=1 Tax=Flavilitoribacter nigricans (strain ATCC 23147 / DSM 23189 / NBRC 102662 / NCIMB 1420 / SS-2) TaxID=1122177 RepID=A0A2D0N3V6_FLAN2|nr:tetratricopeptide repeat protein [Flavilitoribacter nigricans]PHN03201.1 hypothetical protein CRP01_27800 [Flavilitoribacter nigricans DSM 23189 = NBRC 102662]
MTNRWLVYGLGIFLAFIGRIHGQTNLLILEDSPAAFRVIEEALEKRDFDTTFERCNEILEKSRDPKTRGIAVFYKTAARWLIAEETGNYPSFQEAIEEFELAEYEPGLAMAYFMEGEYFYFEQEFDQADSLYDLFIPLARSSNFYRPLSTAYQKKADMLNFRQQTDSAIVNLKSALHYARQDGNESETKEIINQIATSHHALGQLDSAIQYFNQLLEIKLAMSDTEGLLSDYIALGKLYRERGDYENAQQHLMSALQLSETERDTFSIITVYSEIGDIHAAQSLWVTAENYYQQALNLAHLKDRKFAEANCYKKLGDFFLLQNKKENAISNYEAALAIYQELNNKTNTADLLIRLSQVYEEGQDFNQARELLLEALDIRKHSRDPLSSLSIKQALAGLEIEQGNLSRGIAYAEECYEAFSIMDDKKHLQEICELLAGAYGRAGDYRQALAFSQEFNQLQDSLTSIDRTRVIKELDARFNIEKKDKEIAQQNERINAQQLAILKKNNQLLMLAAGLALLALLALLLFFIYWKNKQLNQQRIAILEKEKETQRLKAIIEGEEKERKRFAQELHDGLGAILATVKMQINGIKRKLPEAEKLQTYQKAESLIDTACTTVREISHNLTPYVLEQQGLFFAIEDMCRNLSLNHNAEFHFMSFGSDEALPDILKITLLRITQEMLKNIVNHADAREVIVQLTVEDDEVILVVEDDGKGFDIAKTKKGIGLDNIQSRINYLQGTLDVDSTIGSGSTFTVQLPLPEQ